MPYVTHTIVDHSGERSFTRHYLPAITAANYATITGNTPATQNVGSLRLALGAITDGNFVKHEVTAVSERTVLTGYPVTDDNAQRELKVILRFLSYTYRPYSVEIPAPDLTGITTPGTDVITPNTAWQNLINSILANFVNSYGEELTSFVDGRIVGRRL